MEMEHFLFSLFIFKASIKYGVREWELHKPNLNLTTFCATESEVSVVPPPHLFSYLFLLWHKRHRKQVQQNISNNKFFIQISNDRRITWWNSNMIGMKILKDKDAPNYLAGVV